VSPKGETVSPEERAADILRRCGWRADEHPGEGRPDFLGLDVEIAAAIRAAVGLADRELAACRRLVEGLAERVAAQSALLSRRAEKGGTHA
jgi:hypothetical protein